uniref:Uncharacterized protein n=2 Tax=Octopus bimaculoides TaxID=37653 RepID=A0A0L8GIA9_OCTBM
MNYIYRIYSDITHHHPSSLPLPSSPPPPSPPPPLLSSPPSPPLLSTNHLPDASGMVKLWHYPTATCLATISEKRQTLSIEVNPDRTKLLTTGSDALIHVYDLETRQLINTCGTSDSQQLMDGHKFRVFAAQYHPATQNTFISGGWDNTVQYWDDRNPHSFRHFTGPHICGDSLDIDASTNQILTGSWRRTDILQIWDFLTGAKIHDVPQNMDDTSSLYCAQWLGEDSIVSGGSSKNMAQVHNRTTLNVIGKLTNLPKAVYCIDNDHLGLDATIAIGFDCYIYLVKSERTGEVRVMTPESTTVRAYSVNNDF